MKKYLKYVWVLCLLMGTFYGMFFGLKKDRIEFTWGETDSSTKEVFKDISFGFDIANNIGETVRTVEGKNETLRVSSKKEYDDTDDWKSYVIWFYVHKDDVKDVTDSNAYSKYDGNEKKGKEGITDTIYASVQIRNFSEGKEKNTEILRQKIKLKKEIRIFFVDVDDNFRNIESILFDAMNNIEKEYVDDVMIQNGFETIRGKDTWYYVYGKEQLESAYNTILNINNWGNQTSVEDVHIPPTIYRENKQGEITKFLILDEKESIITGCVDSSSLILVVRTQIKNVFHYELRRYDENGKLVNKKEISNLGFPYTVFCKDKKLLLYDGSSVGVYNAENLKYLHQIDVYSSSSFDAYNIAVDNDFISYKDERLYVIEDSIYNGKQRVRLICYDTDGNSYTKNLEVDWLSNFSYPEEYFENFEMSGYSNMIFSTRFDMYRGREMYLSNFWINEH